MGTLIQIRCGIIIGTKKGTIIFTSTHVDERHVCRVCALTLVTSFL